jgi:site-specific DNA recombinase
LRVSSDKSGELRSVDEQHQDNERAADREGWVLGAPYLEPGAVSASRYSRKARPGFDALCADLKAGLFGADVLIIWESSRGTRRLSEWAAFLELLEENGVLVHVTSHGHTYDLSRPRDRRSLQEDGTDAEYESGKISERVTRAMASNAEKGRPHGRVPYGYRREYEVTAAGKRIIKGQHIEPDEAEVVREIYTALAELRSLRSIAASLNKREVPSPSGGQWTPFKVRYLALNAAYAGLRGHRPGARKGQRVELGTLTDATWPAIVSKETFFAVHSLLTDPKRATLRPGRARHLLSLIGKCDVCGGPLSAAYRGGGGKAAGYAYGRSYECRDKNCVRIDADSLDAYATECMLGFLATPEAIERLRDPGADDGRLAKVRDDLAEARAELKRWRTAAGQGRVTLDSFAEIEPGIVARISALEAAERELLTPPALALIPPGKDVAQRWEAAEVHARRQVARMLLSKPYLGELRVKRSIWRGHVIPPRERVRWERAN